jgi:hypothetical protein
MNQRKSFIELFGMSALFVLLSLLGLLWDVVSRLLFNGIDGIFLAGICLMMAGIFSLEIYVTARASGLLGTAEKKPAAPAAAAPAKPAAVSAAGPSPNAPSSGETK